MAEEKGIGMNYKFLPENEGYYI